MSFLRPSALHQFLITCLSVRWMPCESWGFLRWPGLDGSLKILIGLLLWSTFSEIRFIPSSSMYPTLRIGDRIIVEKASYYFRNPSIHDIVTFRAPFQVRDGSLYVNGIAQNEDFIAEHPKYTSDLTYVPVGYVYVLGDNRNNSFDSHVWLSGWDGAANSWFLTRFSVTIHVLLVCSLFYMFTCCRVENGEWSGVEWSWLVGLALIADKWQAWQMEITHLSVPISLKIHSGVISMNFQLGTKVWPKLFRSESPREQQAPLL
ncbi:peptidase S26 domain-containing protein [Citrus sinensis]|uniref:Peptidase S26 domain-containing protein n=1 Tax=Citrus sinensis TaxID=2711 RepID=A0ACB8KS42_CITSI|nr:peptidase S26 domain-containing protein [Citrus sinensis]